MCNHRSGTAREGWWWWVTPCSGLAARPGRASPSASCCIRVPISWWPTRDTFWRWDFGNLNYFDQSNTVIADFVGKMTLWMCCWITSICLVNCKAHTFKLIMQSDKSALANVISKIRTKSRIVLTGTPMQNNLMEYYQMVDFIAPNLLGTKKVNLIFFRDVLHHIKL